MTLVLVVDDELVIRRAVRKMLERAGYDVLEAANGVDALLLLERTTPDVLITDLHMPSCDGFELTRALRQSGRAQPKIIIISGDDDPATLRSAQAAGATALSKPFTYEDLLRTVASVNVPSPQGLLVLVVDDEPDVCLAFRYMLEADHFRVAVAANGRQALGHIATDPVDVILTDLCMPDLDGLGLLRHLRQAAASPPKVIAMTGSAMLDRKTALEEARLLGAGAVLEKPISRQQLLRAIQSVVTGAI
jgi:CheY-like chemotaxis protein